MRIDFPSDVKVHIETNGCQSLRIELSDHMGLPFCMLEMSLDQAMAIAHFLRSHKVPSEAAKSGWELK